MKKALASFLALLLSGWFNLALSTLAWADVAVDAVSTDTAQDAATLSWSHTVTGTNNLLICGAHIANGGVVSTYKFNGIDLALKLIRDELEMWFLIAPATGAHTVDLVLDLNADSLVGGCTSFTDVHQTVPLGSASTNTNTGDVNSSPPSITVPSGGLAYDVVSFGNRSGACATPTEASGGQTQIYDDCVGSSGDNSTGASSTRSTTGSMFWDNLPSAFGAQIAVPINKAAAAATRRPIGPIVF